MSGSTGLLDLPGLHDFRDNLLSLFKKPSLLPPSVSGKGVYRLLSDGDQYRKKALVRLYQKQVSLVLIWTTFYLREKYTGIPYIAPGYGRMVEKTEYEVPDIQPGSSQMAGGGKKTVFIYPGIGKGLHAKKMSGEELSGTKEAGTSGPAEESTVAPSGKTAGIAGDKKVPGSTPDIEGDQVLTGDEEATVVTGDTGETGTVKEEPSEAQHEDSPDETFVIEVVDEKDAAVTGAVFRVAVDGGEEKQKKTDGSGTMRVVPPGQGVTLKLEG